MVKPVDEEEMLWRVEALLRRYRSTAERRLTVGSTVLDRSALQVITPQGTQQLTAKEFMLLLKLLSYPGLFSPSASLLMISGTWTAR